MKRLIISALVSLLSVLALAVPADKTSFLYRQPDGTTILLRRHGDEYYHWTTDSQGRILQKNRKGFYEVSSISEAAHRANIRKASARRRSAASYDAPPVTNFGERKILCIIANFSDSTFVIENPRDKFDAMLNRQGYDYNNAIGSVRDYYVENSLGQYKPSFDVYGPVTLSRSSAYYDDYEDAGGSVAEAIMEAYELLKDQINIDDYDTDGDGNIDMVLFYYPGHNEAEGGGEESIWPHQSTWNYGSMGGKNLNRYFCTSELRGSWGSVMCSIGTTCHEFAHSLGLPDFYDTDYEKSGGNNENTTGQYDLMTSGCYNHLGRRPPYLGAMERYLLGWMDFPQEILQSGDYSLGPVSENSAYMSSTMTEGEFFIYEYRTRSGWDTGLTEGGLLVYHVDQSNQKVPGSEFTAKQLWDYTNSINAYYGHPCFSLLESQGGSYVFPGQYHVASLDIVQWDGQSSGLFISGIKESGGKAYFKAAMEEGRSILGVVTDSDGLPVSGARVVLSKAAYEFQAPSLLKDDVVAYTDDSGYYRFNLSSDFASLGILTASADGFVPLSVNLKINDKFTGYDFTMIHIGQEKPFSLRRYNTEQGASVTDFGIENIALGMKYTSAEMSGYVGGKIASLSFMAYAGTYKDVYVIVDFGSERVLTKKVTSQYLPSTMITVDLASENLSIPAGKDIFFGFGLTGLDISEESYNLIVYKVNDSNNGNLWSSSVTSGPSGWRTYSFGDDLFYIPPIEAVVGMPVKADFSVLGVSYVVLDGNVPSVCVASGKTLKEVTWTLDGKSVGTPPAVTTLTAGAHTYAATLIYYDGTREKVIYDYVK